MFNISAMLSAPSCGHDAAVPAVDVTPVETSQRDDVIHLSNSHIDVHIDSHGRITALYRKGCKKLVLH